MKIQRPLVPFCFSIFLMMITMTSEGNAIPHGRSMREVEFIEDEPDQESSQPQPQPQPELEPEPQPEPEPEPEPKPKNDPIPSAGGPDLDVEPTEPRRGGRRPDLDVEPTEPRRGGGRDPMVNIFEQINSVIADIFRLINEKLQEFQKFFS